MSYTTAWNEAAPSGGAQANTIDDIIRAHKLDLRERLGGIFGLSAGQFAADPIAPISLTLSGAFVAASGAFSGAVSAATLSGTLLTATQGSVTSLGTLTSLTVSGAITATAANHKLGSPSGTGGVKANQNILLYDNSANNWAGIQADVNGNVVISVGIATRYSTQFSWTGDVIFPNGITGLLLTAAQPNITSLGTQVVTLGSTAEGVVTGSGRGTLRQYMNLFNTGGNLTLGIESSAGGTLHTGTSAYAAVVGTGNAVSLQFATNNIVRQTIDSAGNVAFTGTVTASNFVGPTSIAGTALTGTVLATNIVTSSLTSVGSLVSLSVLSTASPAAGIWSSNAAGALIQINNNVASARGAGIEFLQNGVTSGYIATEGVLLGTTSSFMSIWGVSTDIRFYVNNVGTLRGSITSAGFVGNLTGTILTAAQANITSLGTLTSLTSSGDIVSGTAMFVNNIAGFINIYSSSGGHFNWHIRKSDTVANWLQFSPSTLADGITWSTPTVSFAHSGQLLVGTTSLTGVTAGGIGVSGDSRFDGTINSTKDGLILSRNVAGTSIQYAQFLNTTGGIAWGVESSTGGGLVTGATGYDAVIRGKTGLTFSANDGANIHLRIASTGAVTANGAWTFNSTVGGITTLTATTLNGILGTAAQTNVTSVGQLTSLQVSQPGGFAQATASTYALRLAADDIAIGSNGSTNVFIQTFASRVLWLNNQGNLVHIGASGLTVDGTITGALTGDVTGNLTGTVLTAAQASITSLGTLTSLSVSGTANHGTGHIAAGVSTSVTGTTTIYTTVANTGVLMIVFGSDGTNAFCDLVMTGSNSSNITVISQHTITSTPAGRTYTIPSGVLKLAMASGTYTVKTMPLYAV